MSDFETVPVGTKALVQKLLDHIAFDKYVEEPQHCPLVKEAERLGYLPTKETPNG